MSLPPLPEGLDLTANRGPEIICAVSITWFLALVAVGARILSRRLIRYPLWYDDWLIVASLIPSGTSMLVVSAYMVPHGLGKHVWAAPPEASRDIMIGFFINELAYANIVLVKTSILALYWRIFSVYKSIWVPIRVSIAIVLVWGLARTVVVIVQCIPVHAYWDRFAPVDPIPPSDYNCGVNDQALFEGAAIPNIVLDVIILSLPIPYIWDLQLQAGQKVALILTFAIGLLVTAVSILRLVLVIRLDILCPDRTWNIINVQVWSLIEINIAIFCACLPSLKPLYMLVSGRAKSSSARRKKTIPASSPGTNWRHSKRLREPNQGRDPTQLPSLSTDISVPHDTSLDTTEIEMSSSGPDDLVRESTDI